MRHRIVKAFTVGGFAGDGITGWVCSCGARGTDHPNNHIPDQEEPMKPITATDDKFRVRTPNGYVGRLNMTDPLTDTMFPAFGYVYDDRAAAEQVAAQFPGAELEPWRPTNHA